MIEDCYVTEIQTEKQRAGQYDRVTSAVTSKGDIKCDAFINCTGMVSYLGIYLFTTYKRILFCFFFSGHEILDFNLHRVFEFLHKHAVSL